MWTRDAWKNGVTEKTICNCWRKVGILPRVIDDEPEAASSMNELAMLLLDFASYDVPDVMSADELQAIDAALPTEAEDSAEVECDVEKDDSSEDDSVAAPVPFTLKQAREAATRLAVFVQSNSEIGRLSRFVDASNELAIELDNTIVTVAHRQARLTSFMSKP